MVRFSGISTASTGTRKESSLSQQEISSKTPSSEESFLTAESSSSLSLKPSPPDLAPKLAETETLLPELIEDTSKVDVGERSEESTPVPHGKLKSRRSLHSTPLRHSPRLNKDKLDEGILNSSHEKKSVLQDALTPVLSPTKHFSPSRRRSLKEQVLTKNALRMLTPKKRVVETSYSKVDKVTKKVRTANVTETSITSSVVEKRDMIEEEETVKRHSHTEAQNASKIWSEELSYDENELSSPYKGPELTDSVFQSDSEVEEESDALEHSKTIRESKEAKAHTESTIDTNVITTQRDETVVAHLQEAEEVSNVWSEGFSYSEGELISPYKGPNLTDSIFQSDSEQDEVLEVNSFKNATETHVIASVVVRNDATEKGETMVAHLQEAENVSNVWSEGFSYGEGELSSSYKRPKLTDSIFQSDVEEDEGTDINSFKNDNSQAVIRSHDTILKTSSMSNNTTVETVDVAEAEETMKASLQRETQSISKVWSEDLNYNELSSPYKGPELTDSIFQSDSEEDVDANENTKRSQESYDAGMTESSGEPGTECEPISKENIAENTGQIVQSSTTDEKDVEVEDTEKQKRIHTPEKEVAPTEEKIRKISGIHSNETDNDPTLNIYDPSQDSAGNMGRLESLEEQTRKGLLTEMPIISEEQYTPMEETEFEELHEECFDEEIIVQQYLSPDCESVTVEKEKEVTASDVIEINSSSSSENDKQSTSANEESTESTSSVSECKSEATHEPENEEDKADSGSAVTSNTSSKRDVENSQKASSESMISRSEYSILSDVSVPILAGNDYSSRLRDSVQVCFRKRHSTYRRDGILRN